VNRVDRSELIEKAKSYLAPPKVALIEDAFSFAEKAHDGQLRLSGEPYIEHPLSVAFILAEIQLDAASLIAALLHDVPEDAGVPISEIESHFGAEIAKLVDGVTKLTRLSEQAAGGSPAVVSSEAQVENLRKMLVAMAEDIRVVFIKLADRLHNMRTLAIMPPEKQQRIAKETLEIYAPLAHRLGIWELKWQLEDLAFRYLEPEKYRHIARMLAAKRTQREELIAKVIPILKQEFDRAGLRVEIFGRAKHIYSIYQKMQKYAAMGRDFDDIHDLLALRVLVSTVTDCYTAVGIIHNLWHPLPGEFDDFIANPKPNGYQALHTSVMSLDGTPLEVQIRTRDMHYVDEYGVAAHWRYKEGEKNDLQFENKLSWLRQLIEWHRELSGAEEFLESVKTDIFIDQVFVFTPKGEIKDLPKGATPLDLAYRIHTELGHRCIGAKVNGRMVPLPYQLANGDVVEIMTTKEEKGPSLDWLSSTLGFVKTTHAKNKIRQYFKKQERVENVERGRKILEKELRHLGIRLSEQETLAKDFKYEDIDDFFAAIGDGSISTQQIALKLAGEEAPPKQAAPAASPDKPSISTVQVLGEGNVLTHLGRCCRPVPGDRIVGYVTRNRGVTVHREDCYNITREKEIERLVPVEWGQTDAVYPVKVQIKARDRVGLARDVTTIVAEEKVNISQLGVSENSNHTVYLNLSLMTRGLTQLSRLLSRIEKIKGVISATRIREEASTRTGAA
jgi:GTP pyrophosphokinase